VTSYRLSRERIEHAAKVVDPVFLNTPQFVCEPLGEELGLRLALKIGTIVCGGNLTVEQMRKWL